MIDCMRQIMVMIIVMVLEKNGVLQIIFYKKKKKAVKFISIILILSSFSGVESNCN